jgi:molecular chaperone DnaJ
MTKRDYYEILGLGQDADIGSIKKSYRNLAMKYHPDKNPGDKEAEERFKEVAEAYEVLKDPEKRAKYDQFGHAGISGAAGRGFSGGFAGFDLSDALRSFMQDFGGFGAFDDFFGDSVGRRRRSAARRGGDLQVRVPLTLREISEGVEKTIKLKRKDTCSVCQGSGSREGKGIETCPSCGGTGEIRRAQRSIFGQFVNVTACSRCGGEGTIIKKPCTRCSGEGRTTAERKIKVKIPTGVTSGNYITIQGEGNKGLKNGPPGDLIVLIEEKADKNFRRHGDDIVFDLAITFSQAALGDQVDVPTLAGKARVTIPPGTQTGKILRMNGKGIPHLRGQGKGDQLIRIVVWTPTKLSEEEQKLFNELKKVESEKPPTDDKTFWDRMRNTLS